MKDPEQDELWALLGKARKVEPSAFFAARVLATVRQVDARRRGFWQNWISFGLPGAAAGALAVFLTFLALPAHHTKKVVESKPIVISQAEPSDVEVIADLDYDMASEESSVWLDSSAR
ncbi:MAG: hypothetical protein JO069_06080 [Verrucomicrobia bacterium]|nr:hypothetical protein [Verrucomicrobiota bacterium]